jgi:hypothetical protein
MTFLYIGTALRHHDIIIILYRCVFSTFSGGRDSIIILSITTINCSQLCIIMCVRVCTSIRSSGKIRKSVPCIDRLRCDILIMSLCIQNVIFYSTSVKITVCIKIYYNIMMCDINASFRKTKPQ